VAHIIAKEKSFFKKKLSMKKQKNVFVKTTRAHSFASPLMCETNQAPGTAKT